MTSALQSLTNTKDTGRLDLISKLLNFSPHYLVHSPDPLKSAIRDFLMGISNIAHCSHATIPVVGTSVDDLAPPWSCYHPTMHLSRMAAVDRHDTDAWIQERKVHGTELNAAAVSPSLGPNGTVPDELIPVNVAKSGFTLMELQTELARPVERCSNGGGHCEDTGIHRDDWTSLAAAGLGVSQVRPNSAISPRSRKNLSGDRCQVSEILVHRGITNVSGALPTIPTVIGCDKHTSNTCPTEAPVTSSVTAESPSGSEKELLITALADWTSDWVYTLVVQPYLQGSFRFQYQGKPSKASTSVASRIRRALITVGNPVQVAIYALWFIDALTRSSTHDNPPFLSVPIFQYLHDNGTFLAEEFMFRTFVTCAMIGDKTVNDTALSTKTWNRLTRIPQVILNATEKYALSCLRWNVVMSRIQWQDTITYLRSCVKMSSAFDPFSYDETSPSCIMAWYFDQLINLSHADVPSPRDVFAQAETLVSQSTQRFTRLDSFHMAEWRPEHDPIVNQKPRTIGIAPGANPSSSTLKVGTTAKDLLDAILGSNGVPDLTHLAQPAGTSFCGSFGVIGASLAHTIRITNACRSASWVPSHG